MKRLAFLLTALSALGGCASTFDAEPGKQVAANYIAPPDYAAHREQQQLFATSGGRIAYTDHGTPNDTTLVLIHGVPTSSWMYRKVIPELQHHARVITVDLLGYGSSDKPDDAGSTYTPAAQAERVRALLAALDVETYGIVMHDMGGLVAWELLREDVRRVSHLVVLNTIIHKQGFEHPDFEPGMLTRQMTKAMSNRLTSAAALELTFRNLGLTGDEALSEEECFGYVRPMREGASPALYAFYSSLNDDLYQRLEENKSWFERVHGRHASRVGRAGRNSYNGATAVPGQAPWRCVGELTYLPGQAAFHCRRDADGAGAADCRSSIKDSLFPRCSI